MQVSSSSIVQGRGRGERKGGKEQEYMKRKKKREARIDS